MFKVNPLLGFNAGGAAPPVPVATFIGFTELISGASTYTFTAAALGAVVSGVEFSRRIIVAATWSDNTTATTQTGTPTINGVNAVVHATGTSSSGNFAIFSALVPTGTTGNIVFAIAGGSASRATIAVYRHVNETSSSPFATLVDNTVSGASTTASVWSGTLDVPINGTVIAVGQPTAATTPGVCTWTGVTSQYDGVYSGAAGIRRSGGFQTSLAAQTARTITASFAAATSAANGRMGAVAWG